MFKKRYPPTAYALPHFFDVLSFHFLAELKQWRGKFYQDRQFPPQIWWLCPKPIPDIPYAPQKVPDDLDNVTWLELLSSLGIEEDANAALSNTLVIETQSFAVFSQLVQDHFMLQRGQMDYVQRNTIWYLRLSQPSLWSLSRLPINQWRAFNLQRNIYLERGWKWKLPHLQTHLYLPEEQTILLDSSGQITSFTALWQTVDQLLHFEIEKPLILTQNQPLEITIKPKLVKTEKPMMPSLWYFSVEGLHQLEKILYLNPELLGGFRAWFHPNEGMFIFALPKIADPILIERLNHAECEAFWAYERNTFLPSDCTLMPTLGVEYIQSVFGTQNDDVICIRGQDTEFRTHIFKLKDMHPLQDYIRIKILNHLTEFKPFNQQWHLTYTPAQTQTQILLEWKQHSSPPKISSKSQVLKPIHQAHDADPAIAIPTSNTEQPRTEHAIEKLLTQLKAIDQHLLKEIEDSEAWYQRAELSTQLNFPISAFLGAAMGDILTHQLLTLLQRFENLLIDEEDCLSPLVDAPETAGEDQRGELLALIRAKSSGRCAEFQWLAGLYFSFKFAQPAIFNEANQMLLYGQHLPLFQFEDSTFQESIEQQENSPLNLSNISTTACSQICSQYTAQLSQVKSPIAPLLIKQFEVFIRNHFPQTPFAWPEIKAPQEDLLLAKWQILLGGHLPSQAGPYLTTWRERISMPELEQISLGNLFLAGESVLFDSYFFAHTLPNQSVEMYFDFAEGIQDWWQPYLPKAKLKLKDPNAYALEWARFQKMILKLIMQYGPLPAFRPLIQPMSYENLGYLSSFVQHCDAFRMHLLYHLPLEETQFFQRLLLAIEEAPSYMDFVDMSETLLLCLFLAQSTEKKPVFNRLFQLGIEWSHRHLYHDDALDRLLAFFCYLQLFRVIGESVSASMTRYQFQFHRQKIWLDFAQKHQAGYAEYSRQFKER